MQLFSLAPVIAAIQTAAATAPAAPPDSADSIVAEFARIQGTIRPGIVLLWLGVTQVLAIVAYWIASNLINREEGRFINAIKLWAFYIAASIVVGVLFGVGMVWGASQASGAFLFATFVVGIMLGIIVVLGCPMKIYKLGVGGGIGFVLIAFVLTIAGQLVAARFLPEPLDMKGWAALGERAARLPTAERNKLAERIHALQKTGDAASAPAKMSDEKIAGDRTKSIDDRHAAVQRIYRALEARRVALKPDDSEAIAQYTRDETQYQDLLRQLQADAQAATPK